VARLAPRVQPAGNNAANEAAAQPGYPWWVSLMRIALGIVAGFLLGGFLGYMLGIFVACEIFDAGNLCGLVGVFITGPLGALSGSVVGGLLSQRRSAQQTS
jgi:hypothetical protein